MLYYIVINIVQNFEIFDSKKLTNIGKKRWQKSWQKKPELLRRKDQINKIEKLKNKKERRKGLRFDRQTKLDKTNCQSAHKHTVSLSPTGFQFVSHWTPTTHPLTTFFSQKHRNHHKKRDSVENQVFPLSMNTTWCDLCASRNSWHRVDISKSLAHTGTYFSIMGKLIFVSPVQ